MGLPGFKDFKWNRFDVEDDMDNLKLNHSFILEAFEGKRMTLLNQFLDNKVMNDYFTKGRIGKRIVWNETNCISWMKKCKQLLGMIATACHLLGGQPGRGTEMATTRWKNSVDELRGVYWAQGTVVLLGQYSKTRSITSQNRMIPRFLPPELGYLLTEYLAIVRPIEVLFSNYFKCTGRKDLNEFLWADYKKGIWSGEYLSDLLKLHTSKNEMRGLGFREYRQVAIAFMEKHVKHKLDRSWEVEENILNLQAGHVGRTVERYYASAVGDSRVIGREAMHQYYLGSKAWYMFLLNEEIEASGQGRFDLWNVAD
jgi:hypothetical protein